MVWVSFYNKEWLQSTPLLPRSKQGHIVGQITLFVGLHEEQIQDAKDLDVGQVLGFLHFGQAGVGDPTKSSANTGATVHSASLCTEKQEQRL